MSSESTPTKENPHRPSTLSNSSSESIPNSYHGLSDEEKEHPDTIKDPDPSDIGELHRVVTQSRQSNERENVLTRLSTLSRTLSHLSYADMKSFRIDPDDFDLKRVLNFISSRNEEQGLPQKKTWVVYDDLTVIGNNASAAVV